MFNIYTMEEKVLDILKDLGFKVVILEDLGYEFIYEGIRYVFLTHEHDANLITISIPSVYSKENDRLMECFELMYKINNTISCVKTNFYKNSIWLSYEYQIIGGEDLKPVVANMISQLYKAWDYTRVTKRFLRYCFDEYGK